MNTLNPTQSAGQPAAQTAAKTGLRSIVMVALIGASLVYVAGFANAQVLHDVAHDARHSTGFPCH